MARVVIPASPAVRGIPTATPRDRLVMFLELVHWRSDHRPREYGPRKIDRRIEPNSRTIPIATSITEATDHFAPFSSSLFPTAQISHVDYQAGADGTHGDDQVLSE